MTTDDARSDGRPAGTPPADVPRVGLALAGGVVEGGFYEVGVLCALEDAIDGLALDALDMYVGVSSGALLASLLANGVPPRTLARAVVGEAGAGLDLRPELLFDVAWGEALRRVGRVPGLLAGIARRTLARPRDQTPYALLATLGAALPAGLFEGRALERFLERALSAGGRTNDFRVLARRTRLRVVAVDLDTSALVDFGTPATAHVPIARAVRASAALPGLYTPVEIDGRHYIDGVARRTMHASVALDAGTRLLFCVNPIVPVDVRGDAVDGTSIASHGLPAVLSQTFRTLVHSRMTSSFAHYAARYPDADVVLIEPPMADRRLFFSNVFSFANRRGVTEHAYQSTRRWLRANAARLAPVLARHGLTLRHDALTDARTLYPERRSAPRGPSTSAPAVVHELARLDGALDRVAEQAAR